ncbi:MAG: hypothetical protein Q8R53_02970 [Nanoarchaeota archaeon]|nr:hypothetical protein [Nanoarchaeota archaeon]
MKKMVVELQSTLNLVIVVFASLTAFLGIIVVNTLFRNKLKELFSDAQFFIFFFLVFGYSLYALGEVTWFLILNLFQIYSIGSMPDIYWVSGTVLMLLPLIALSRRLYRTDSHYRNPFPLLVFGAVLLLVALFSVSLIKGSFLDYYYAGIGALILVASIPLFIFYRMLQSSGSFEANLVYLFFSNICFLLSQFLYTYIVPREIYGSLGVLADSMYALGYFLSAFAFLMLLIKFYSSSRKQVVA